MAELDLIIAFNDGTEVDVTFLDTLTGNQLIEELVRSRFIALQPYTKFALALKGGLPIDLGQAIAQAGLTNGDRIYLSVYSRGNWG